MIVYLIVVRLMVVYLIIQLKTSFKFWMTKNQKFFQALIVETIGISKFKVQCDPKYSQNVKKIAFHQGLDHFNSPKVPHNGYKGTTKDTKPK